MDTDGDGIGDVKGEHFNQFLQYCDLVTWLFFKTGIISKLDHLKDAGIDACWLSPIFASPQVDTGYDVSDFYKIEPDYGDMDDFDNLMAKANELGIKLMLDFIPNHTSDQHQWFIDSENNVEEYRDYYVWRDAKIVDGVRMPPTNWGEVLVELLRLAILWNLIKFFESRLFVVSVFGGSAWEWSEKRNQYYLHQFSAQQVNLLSPWTFQLQRN